MSYGHHLIGRRPLKSLGEVFKAEGTKCQCSETEMSLSRDKHSEEAHVVEASAPSTCFSSSYASHTLPTCLSMPLPISNSNSNPSSSSFLILKSEVIPPCRGLMRARFSCTSNLSPRTLLKHRSHWRVTLTNLRLRPCLILESPQDQHSPRMSNEFTELTG